MLRDAITFKYYEVVQKKTSKGNLPIYMSSVSDSFHSMDVSGPNIILQPYISVQLSSLSRTYLSDVA